MGFLGLSVFALADDAGWFWRHTDGARTQDRLAVRGRWLPKRGPSGVSGMSGVGGTGHLVAPGGGPEPKKDLWCSEKGGTET